MSVVHSLDLEGPAALACAQTGCPACPETLLQRHEGLVHMVLRQQARGGVAYDDLLQEGRIALWQALLHFDVQRGVAFSTYAWVAIQRRLWRAVAQATRPQGWLPPPKPLDPLEAAARTWWLAQVRGALAEALAYLPEHQRVVIVAAYGLDGQPSRSLAAIGRQCGVSRERVRQWRNDALVLLRWTAASRRISHTLLWLITGSQLCACRMRPATVRQPRPGWAWSYARTSA